MKSSFIVSIGFLRLLTAFSLDGNRRSASATPLHGLFFLSPLSQRNGRGATRLQRDDLVIVGSAP
jgi:hypothetical protein